MSQNLNLAEKCEAVFNDEWCIIFCCECLEIIIFFHHKINNNQMGKDNVMQASALNQVLRGFRVERKLAMLFVKTTAIPV